jgi:hypothetical protein
MGKWRPRPLSRFLGHFSTSDSVGRFNRPPVSCYGPGVVQVLCAPVLLCLCRLRRFPPVGLCPFHGKLDNVRIFALAVSLQVSMHPGLLCSVSTLFFRELSGGACKSARCTTKLKGAKFGSER